MGEIKTAYIQELEQRLSDSWVEMEQLEARMKKGSGVTRQRLFIELETARKQSDETREKLQALRDVEHPDWETLRDEVDEAWTNLRSHLQNLGKAISEKLHS